MNLHNIDHQLRKKKRLLVYKFSERRITQARNKINGRNFYAEIKNVYTIWHLTFTMLNHFIDDYRRMKEILKECENLLSRVWV